MVRTYIRKIDRGEYDTETLAGALAAVKSGISLEKAAGRYGTARTVLRRHREGKVSAPGIAKLDRFRPVHASDLEKELTSKIQKMERDRFGLTPICIRKLAFELAVTLRISHNFCNES